jgi:hypothetical protein
LFSEIVMNLFHISLQTKKLSSSILDAISWKLVSNLLSREASSFSEYRHLAYCLWRGKQVLTFRFLVGSDGRYWANLTSNRLHTAPCYLKMVQVMQVNANVSDYGCNIYWMLPGDLRKVQCKRSIYWFVSRIAKYFLWHCSWK